MKRIIRNLILLFAGAIATACLSSTHWDDREGAIVFNPVLGSEVRSDDIPHFPEDISFGVWAMKDDGSLYIDKEEVSFDGKKWSASASYRWPAKNSLTFTGFAPYQEGFRLKKHKYLTLEHFDLSSADRELYIARETVPYNILNGTANIDFEPAVTKIDFRLNNGLNKETRVRIDKMILKGIQVSGSLDTENDPMWSLTGEKKDIVIFDSRKDGGTKEVTAEMKYFGRMIYVLPQHNEPHIEIVFSFKNPGSDWIPSQIDNTPTISKPWQAGRHYTYSMTLTEQNLKYTTGKSGWSNKVE